MHKRFFALLACLLAAFAVSTGGARAAATVDAAPAITAISVDLAPTANCTSNATLALSWTGAGNHWEFGAAVDRSGTVIGTFGPDSNSNDDWNGAYSIPVTTAQPAGSLIGSYAWVGTNPPTAGTAIEYFVVYNCSTQEVLYRCSGAYGQCHRTIDAAIAPSTVTVAAPIPATSRQMLAALMVLLGIVGGVFLRRRQIRVGP